jgi:hypothetical protein
VVDDGTTFITAGGGGASAYQASLGVVSYVNVERGLRVPEASTWSATRYNDLSFLACDVDGGTMTVRAVKADGKELERVVLKRRVRVGALAS